MLFGLFKSKNPKKQRRKTHKDLPLKIPSHLNPEQWQQLKEDCERQQRRQEAFNVISKQADQLLHQYFQHLEDAIKDLKTTDFNHSVAVLRNAFWDFEQKFAKPFYTQYKSLILLCDGLHRHYREGTFICNIYFYNGILFCYTYFGLLILSENGLQLGLGNRQATKKLSYQYISYNEKGIKAYCEEGFPIPIMFIDDHSWEQNKIHFASLLFYGWQHFFAVKINAHGRRTKTGGYLSWKSKQIYLEQPPLVRHLAYYHKTGNL